MIQLDIEVAEVKVLECRTMHMHGTPIPYGWHIVAIFNDNEIGGFGANSSSHPVTKILVVKKTDYPKDIEALQNQLNEIGENLKKKDKEILSLNSKIEKMDTETKSLNSTLSYYKESNSELQDIYKSKEEKLRKMENDIAKIRQEIGEAAMRKILEK